MSGKNTSTPRCLAAAGALHGADVSVDTTGVWAAIGLSGSSHAEVVRVDPATNQIQARIALQADYVPLAPVRDEVAPKPGSVRFLR